MVKQWCRFTLMLLLYRWIHFALWTDSPRRYTRNKAIATDHRRRIKTVAQSMLPVALIARRRHLSSLWVLGKMLNNAFIEAMTVSLRTADGFLAVRLLVGIYLIPAYVLIGEIKTVKIKNRNKTLLGQRSAIDRHHRFSHFCSFT